MSWSGVFLIASLVLLGGALVEHLLGKSTEERAVIRAEQCAIQCDFQGAVAYSINLGDERDCICTFKLWRKK